MNPKILKCISYKIRYVILGLIFFTKIQTAYSQVNDVISDPDPKTNSQFYIGFNTFEDSLIHLVWDHYANPGVKQYIVERAMDGVNFKAIAKVNPDTLKDLSNRENDNGIKKYKNILMSMETGSKRFIYNDILKNAGKKILLQYRIKIITKNEAELYTKTVGEQHPELEYPEIHISSSTLKPGQTEIIPMACPPVQGQPAGHTPTGNSRQYYSNCCLVTEREFERCNALACAGSDCSCNCTSDPCCYHTCSQYWSCSCHPWVPCSKLYVWRVTAVTPIVLNTNITKKDVSCFGGNDGSATVTVSGGTGNYTYSWSPSGGNSSTANGLTVGTYTVTINDVTAACVTTVNVVISQPTILVASIPSSQNVTCNGGSDGSASGSASGGTPPYSYAWSNGQNTSNASGLSAGTYTLSVTDSKGCIKTANVTITEPPPILTSTTTTDVTCFLGSNGTATINAIGGGTPPYTYSWNTTPIQTTQTATNLVAGNYSVTLKDDKNCEVVENVTINEPQIEIIQTDVSCKSGSDGTVTVNPQGSSPSYTYLWSNGATTKSITGLPAGSYSVTVTDAYFCVISTSAIVTEPTQLIESLSKTHVSCYNGTNGTITVSPSGGTPGYLYLWTPSNKTTASVSNMSAGFYTVKVTDSKGCVVTDTVTLTQPPKLNAAITSSKNISCFNGTDGSASIVGSGGTPGYTYSWNSNPVQNTQTATNLPAGPKTGIVTDAKGCLATASVTLTQPPLLTATINTSKDVSCFGGNDGAATVTPGGGVSPYTYSWNTVPVQTTTSVSGLINGTFNVTVTDANSCTAVTNILISQPQPLVLQTTQTEVSCFGGNDGSITVQPSGGTAAYSYKWSTTPAQTGVTANNLAIGTYTVTVTDSKLCTATISATITQPTALAVSHTQINNLCFGGNNASATENPSGGTPPYTYSWNTAPVQTTQTATNLVAGNYVVTVRDAKACLIADNITITQPTALVATIPVSKNVSCFNGSDGSATALASGGTAGYTYLWSIVPVQNTNVANNLTAGNYAVTITDNNACQSSAIVSITQPNLLTVSLVKSVDVSCKGGSDGSINVSISGGTSPYQIVWNTNPVLTTRNITSLKAGSYTVNVTDNNNCTATTTVVINEPDLVVPVISNIKNVSCFSGNDGSLSVQVSGGSAPYTYNWSTTPVQNTPTAGGLTAGSYTVTVADKFNCTNTVTGIVIEPPLLTSYTSLDQNVSCFNGNNGGATVTALGGTLPYTYSWGTNPAQTTRAAVTLRAGTYSVTVTDAMNCKSVASVIITQPTALVAQISSKKDVSCFGGNDGEAVVTPSGGTAPYTQIWNTTPSQVSTTATGLIAGTYSVTVNDANSCMTSTTVNINEPPILVAVISTKRDVSCFQGNDGFANASQTGGTAPFTYLWSNGVTTALNANLYAGNYSVTVTDAKNCVDTVQVNMYEPTALVSDITAFTNVLCKNGNNGSLTVTANGGTPGYTYLWNTTPVQTGITASNLTAGIYKVLVTDAKGCAVTSTQTITEPDSIRIRALGAVTICIGQSTSVTSAVSGGTPPYTYLWNNGETTDSQVVNPVVTTQYSVVATDANGCASEPSAVTVTVRDPLTVVASGNNTICEEQSGTISAVASGGDGNYTYSWSNGSNIAGPITVSPSVTTTYTVTVTDGCGTPPAQDDVTIDVKPLPVVLFGGDTLKACQPHTVNFTDSTSVLLPTTLTAWHWNFGDSPGVGNTSNLQNPTHTYFNAGVYNVTLIVTTSDNCVDSLTRPAYITTYPLPVAQFISKPKTANVLKPDISFIEQATGETYYFWNFGDGNTSKDANPTHAYSQPGTYNACLTVTSQFNCVDEVCHTVIIEPDFTFYIPNAFSPNDDGINDLFGGSGIGIKEYSLFIFDRWGNKIFISDDINKQWDGRANNGSMVAQQDVYVYIVKVTDIFDVVHKYVGHVSLVR